MRFIKKKNLQEGEELLYVPELHWMYAIWHLLLSLPFLLVLFIVWRSLVGQAEMTLVGILAFVSALAVRNMLLSATIAVMVICLFRTISYLNTEYGVTNKRLIIKAGVFSLKVREIPFDRIESLYCYRGLLGNLFRYGTINISGVGGTVPAFKMVRRPFALRRKIVDILEKNKAITVVHGDELPKPSPSPPPIVKAKPVEEPIYRYGTFVRVLGNNK